MSLILSFQKSFLQQRIVVAIFVFFVGLLAAKTLGTEFFGILYLTVYGGKVLSLLTFGIQSGFLHRFYTDSASGNSDNSAFLFSYAIHLVFISIILLVFVVYFDLKKYAYPIIFFIMLIPAYLIEPIARTKRIFFVSLLPDLIGTSSVLFLIILASAFDVNPDDLHSVFLLVSLTLAIAIISVVLRFLDFSFNFPSGRNFKWWTDYYISLLKNGMPLYVGTGLYLLYTVIDRLFIKEFFANSDLSVYTLSFQLASGATLVLSTLNFTGTIDFGEKVSNRASIKPLCISNVKKALLFAVFGVGVAAFSALILSLFFKDYNGTLYYTLALSIGFSIFFVSGSVTPVLFYLNKTKLLNFGLLLIVFFATVINYFFSIEFNYPLLVVSVNAALLVGYSVFCVMYTFRIVDAYERDSLYE
ncbi:hypothetical protein ACKBF6_002221 [Vibrio cholerae]|uniref:hypothetical protein n=1 Tax=Vibrio cholerae TaxID=666 RepID=UPI002934138F|nr:hypothetical protein [Vibrio cholerae]MDV2397107.1 hypothetical protein [Vibrio cholerae]